MKIDVKTKFTDKKILDLTHKNYPIYKDLEIYKVYEFEHILAIHENLIEILLSISHYLKNKERIAKQRLMKKEKNIVEQIENLNI